MTMTDKNIPTEAELEALFAEAAGAPVVPSAALLDRVMADADRISGARGQRAPARPGWLAALIATLGGWPAVAGLATATVAGIWIGYAAPDTLNQLTDGYLAVGSYEFGDLLPAVDLAAKEG